MLIDITLPLAPEMAGEARQNLALARGGHLGTHFDVMDKAFPLAHTALPGAVLDVRPVGSGEIAARDVDLSRVSPGSFVAFYSGFIERHPYGSQTYFQQHPTLSDDLIGELLARRIAIIGVDFAGIRRGAEHTPADQRCADAGAFVVENLCNLGAVLAAGPDGRFTARTYPMRWEGLTGLPCRVVAEV